MITVSKELITRCMEADRHTQKVLFGKLYGPMYRVCFRYLGNQPEAEDCTMKGFMKAFQSLEKFEYQGDHSFFGWIRRIMVNESLMELRKKSRLMLVPQDEGEQLPDRSDVIDQLSAEQIYRVVTSLPDGYRTVFNLYVVEGYSHQEIASMLNITESTSRTQLAKAKSKLRTMVEQLYEYDGTNGK